MSIRCFLALALASGGSAAVAGPKDFADKPVDVGVVVSDLDKAAKFYTEAVGLTEVKGFSVTGEFCKKAGLTDGRPLKVRRFKVGDGPKATSIKLMQLPAAKPAAAKTKYIHSQLGFSYLTVFVKDADAALARLKKAGAAVASDGVVPLAGGGQGLILVRDPDGNLIELIGKVAGK